jgi:hypothetical protein
MKAGPIPIKSVQACEGDIPYLRGLLIPFLQLSLSVGKWYVTVCLKNEL